MGMGVAEGAMPMAVQGSGRYQPVWMMMCLDRSPTLTKALLQTVHLWGRMLSWWRMWLASWLDWTNLWERHHAQHSPC